MRHPINLWMSYHAGLARGLDDAGPTPRHQKGTTAPDTRPHGATRPGTATSTNNPLRD